MTTRIINVLQRSIFTGCAALSLCLLTWNAASAQRYLAEAQRKCNEQVTVTTPGNSAQVRQLEARSAEVKTPKLDWQCGEQPKQVVECPANTNSVLVDRSQGGSTFSIICLQK